MTVMTKGSSRRDSRSGSSHAIIRLRARTLFRTERRKVRRAASEINDGMVSPPGSCVESAAKAPCPSGRQCTSDNTTKNHQSIYTYQGKTGAGQKKLVKPVKQEPAFCRLRWSLVPAPPPHLQVNNGSGSVPGFAGSNRRPDESRATNSTVSSTCWPEGIPAPLS